METSKDFEEFFELLNVHKVRYLVVGGYAFAVHAEPRYTKDLDIFYEAERTNAKKMQDVLIAFGFGALSITVDDLMEPDKIFQIGIPPLRIDLINDIDGLTFKEGWENLIQSMYGDQTINIIGKQSLIKNKKASGRDQDLLDVKQLTE